MALSILVFSSVENATDGEDRWSAGEPEDDEADISTAGACDGARSGTASVMEGAGKWVTGRDVDNKEAKTWKKGEVMVGKCVADGRWDCSNVTREEGIKR